MRKYIVRPNGRTKTKFDVVNTETEEVVATFSYNGAAKSYARTMNEEKN